MLTKKFLRRVDSYLNKRRRTREKNDRLIKELKKKCRFGCVHYVPKEELEARLKSLRETFPQYILNFIAARGLSEVDVYKKVNLDRRIFSKLRNQKDYMPSKRTVLLIAFAMELNLKEARSFLNKGGYSLSELDKKDNIIAFFFENQIYDLFLLNEVLDHYGFKPLGG